MVESCSKASSAYAATENPPVLVSVLFNSSYRVAKSDVARLGRSLFELAVRNLPEEDATSEEEYEWTNREWFPEEFLRVAVARFSFLTSSHWSAPDFGYIPNCSPDLIQVAISRKIEKFPVYASTFPECWLLVVADDFHLSGELQLPAEVLSHVYASPFARTYLFQTFSRRVYRLSSALERHDV